MNDKPVLCFRRNPETANHVQRILGLDNDLWTAIEITMATDSPAMCKVNFYLTGEQVLALANLAVGPPEHFHDFVNDTVCWCGATEQGGEH